MRGLFMRPAPPANPLNGQSSPQGVRQGRRLSNRGRVIAGAAVAGFLVLIGLSSGNGPKKNDQAAAQDASAGSSYSLADEVSGQRATGVIPRATADPTPLASPFATPAPNPAPAPSPTPDEEKKRL